MKNVHIILSLCLALMAGGTGAQGGGLSEPHTVFYGKVRGTGSAQDFLITEGKLEWTIHRADGSLVTLKTSLYAWHDNTFSYRLNVPHAAFALGLPTPPGTIPLPSTPQTHVHAEITLDGETMTLLGPAGSAFTTEQLLRTSTYRLDLGVGRQAVDTDGDGIPDWWEDLYGLDKQDPNDAHTDLSGDGITALEAYERGLDPTRDNRIPVLLTEEVIVYPSGSTALVLDAADLDSAADQLLYTLTAAPVGSALTLRNVYSQPESPDRVLEVGDQFTQADVLKGRLLVNVDDGAMDAGFFSVSLRDENPEHPAHEADVRLLTYEPALYVAVDMSPLEAKRYENYLYAAMGRVIMDASGLSAANAIANPSAGLTAQALQDYWDAYGSDRDYVFMSADGLNQQIRGGHGDDVLVAGAGDGALRGGDGADRFVFYSFESGRVVIEDFETADADVIDFSRLPATGSYVTDYVRLAQVDGVYELQTRLGGAGAPFSDLVVALPGLSAEDADLYRLVEDGHLLIGSLRLEPQITVVASAPRAALNGPTPGQFTIQRAGSVDEELIVQMTMSGSAVNGSDYVHIPGTLVMPAGIRAVNVELMPYPGSFSVAKAAQLTLAAGEGYRLGGESTAWVTIEPLLMVVELSVIEPLAVQETQQSGLLMVRRRDVTHTDATIWLDFSGTAVRGTDYQQVAGFLYLPPNVTTAFIEITPRAAAQLAKGLVAQVSIRSDNDYLIKSGQGIGRVTLIERLDSLAGWQAREFPETSDSSEVFALGDSNAHGINHLQRYAFGLDPHDPDPSGLPRPFLHQGRLGVSFRRPLSVTDVEYRVLAVTDLTAPAAAAVSVQQIDAPDGFFDPEQVYFLVGPDSEDADTVFTVIELEWMP